jgi:hypothetical protein
LGLRAITACLGTGGSGSTESGGTAAAADFNASSSSSPALSGRLGQSSSPIPGQQHQLLQGGDEFAPLPTPRRDEEVIAAAGQMLRSFPLTAATRIALFEVLCDGLPWQQVRVCLPLVSLLQCVFSLSVCIKSCFYSFI